MKKQNKPEMNEREVKRIQFFVYCPYCEKCGKPLNECEIKGNSREQVYYALGIHIKQKHKKNGPKTD